MDNFMELCSRVPDMSRTFMGGGIRGQSAGLFKQKHTEYIYTPKYWWNLESAKKTSFLVFTCLLNWCWKENGPNRLWEELYSALIYYIFVHKWDVYQKCVTPPKCSGTSAPPTVPKKRDHIYVNRENSFEGKNTASGMRGIIGLLGRSDCLSSSNRFLVKFATSAR